MSVPQRTLSNKEVADLQRINHTPLQSINDALQASPSPTSHTPQPYALPDSHDQLHAQFAGRAADLSPQGGALQDSGETEEQEIISDMSDEGGEDAQMGGGMKSIDDSLNKVQLQLERNKAQGRRVREDKLRAHERDTQEMLSADMQDEQHEQDKHILRFVASTKSRVAVGGVVAGRQTVIAHQAGAPSHDSSAGIFLEGAQRREREYGEGTGGEEKDFEIECIEMQRSRLPVLAHRGAGLNARWGGSRDMHPSLFAGEEEDHLLEGACLMPRSACSSCSLSSVSRLSLDGSSVCLTANFLSRFPHVPLGTSRNTVYANQSRAHAPLPSHTHSLSDIMRGMGGKGSNDDPMSLLNTLSRLLHPTPLPSTVTAHTAAAKGDLAPIPHTSQHSQHSQLFAGHASSPLLSHHATHQVLAASQDRVRAAETDTLIGDRGGGGQGEGMSEVDMLIARANEVLSHKTGAVHTSRAAHRGGEVDTLALLQERVATGHRAGEVGGVAAAELLIHERHLQQVSSPILSSHYVHAQPCLRSYIHARVHTYAHGKHQGWCGRRKRAQRDLTPHPSHIAVHTSPVTHFYTHRTQYLAHRDGRATPSAPEDGACVVDLVFDAAWLESAEAPVDACDVHTGMDTLDANTPSNTPANALPPRPLQIEGPETIDGGVREGMTVDVSKRAAEIVLHVAEALGVDERRLRALQVPAHCCVVRLQVPPPSLPCSFLTRLYFGISLVACCIGCRHACLRRLLCVGLFAFDLQPVFLAPAPVSGQGWCRWQWVRWKQRGVAYEQRSLSTRLCLQLF